jgi:pilus assembly protein CpaF
MFTVIVTEKGGEQRAMEFDKNEVTIGRVQGNDIILPKGNVSKRHSRIVLKEDKFIIVDLKSTNGTYVNGRKITSPMVVKSTDKIYIGDFIMTIQEPGGQAAAEAPPPPPPQAPPRRPAAPPPPPPPKRPTGSMPAAGGPPPGPPPRTIEAEGEGQMPPPGMGPPPGYPPQGAPQYPPPGAPQYPPPGPPQYQQPAPPPGYPPPGAPQYPPPGAPQYPPPGPPQAMPPQYPPPQYQAPPPPAPPPQAPPPPAPPPPAPPPAQAAPTPPSRPAAPPPRAPAVTPKAGVQPAAGARAARTQAPPEARAAMAAGDPKRLKVIELQKEIHERLIEKLDLRRLDVDKLDDEELWEKAEDAIHDIVEAMDADGAIPSFVDQDALIKDVLDEALALGPLEDLLKDDTITEIMVNRADQVYVERAGRIEVCERTFSSDKAVLGVIERIVAPIGRRIDESSPLVDARLKDGSRVNAIIPPLALKGPCLTIRKFAREKYKIEDLLRFGSISQGMAEFLEMCVTARKNIVVAGGTGSGKTTTLNIISNYIPERERIVTVEDAAELQLHHEHWIQLESRPSNIEGKGQITIRDLVRNCLRMRPDRIIVGECRGGEALDMLQAMNTGHDGSLTTAHANSPRDTLSRLETMVLMSGMDLPIRAIREQIASAIDVIVQQSRFSDGSRKITHITEVTGMETDIITMQDIFTFKQEGFDEQGRVRGRYVASGFVPSFYEDLQRRGIGVNMNIFRE